MTDKQARTRHHTLTALQALRAAIALLDSEDYASPLNDTAKKELTAAMLSILVARQALP